MALLPTGGSMGTRRRPELPAFSRTRRRTITVSIGSLHGLRYLLLVLLLLQLSTLLLVLAGPVPPRPQIQTLPAAPLSAAEARSLMPPERRVPQSSGER